MFRFNADHVRDTNGTHTKSCCFGRPQRPGGWRETLFVSIACEKLTPADQVGEMHQMAPAPTTMSRRTIPRY